MGFRFIIYFFLSNIKTYKYAIMLEIVLLIVKVNTNSTWLNKKMLQLTRRGIDELNEENFPIFVLESYDEIDQYKDKAKWLFVQTAGDILFSPHCIRKKIKEIDPKIGFLGIIGWDVNKKIAQIVPYCFLINTTAIQGKTIDFSEGQDFGLEIIRGAEDFDNGNSPHWIGYGKTEKNRYLKFGTKIFTSILDNGYIISNFDNSWRYFDSERFKKYMNSQMYEILNQLDLEKIPTRFYSYPHLNTALFEQAIKKLDSSLTLNLHQSLVIESLKMMVDGHKKIVDVRHQGKINIIPGLKKIICLSNGLMGEIHAYRNNVNDIVFYDICESNINFKKDMYSNNLDGVDYWKFCKDWADERKLIMTPELDPDAPVPFIHEKEYNNVLLNWEFMKQLNKKFIILDIMSDVDTLIDNISENSLLITNGILTNYSMTNILYTTDEIIEVREKINKAIKKTNSYWVEFV